MLTKKLLGLLTAPGPAVPLTGGPRGEFVVRVGPAAVTAEVAASPDKMERGLAGRKSLDRDAGLLLMPGHEADHQITMRGVLIPLDLVFVDKDLMVVAVVRAVAPDTEKIKAGQPSLYVLEVNAGWCQARGVDVGDLVRF